jgi:membrane protein involved in D-alanine export
MTPYADFQFFAILLLYIVIPTIVVRLCLRFSQAWILLATLFMLFVQFHGRLSFGPYYEFATIGYVAAYAAFEYGVARLYLLSRRRSTGNAPYAAALILALAPLILAKFLPRVAPKYEFGFLGISYVTFRAVDVVFSIHDKVITELSLRQYLAFILFFPTVSSGPIDRYRRFANDWKSYPTRAQFLVDLDGAVHRVFTGFLYKFIAAKLINDYWLVPAEKGTNAMDVLSYMYAYSFYLFFDFAGYSMFAIAFSYLLGIHTPENFDRPFLAPNIRDFWNRWHMTLSFWLRDHVYMRFVLAAGKGKWFQGRYTASHIGFLLSFGLMGLWHGIEPHYLVYGFYHAFLLIGYDVFARWNKQRQLWRQGLAWRVAGILVTFHIVAFGFLIFSGHLF